MLLVGRGGGLFVCSDKEELLKCLEFWVTIMTALNYLNDIHDIYCPPPCIVSNHVIANSIIKVGKNMFTASESGVCSNILSSIWYAYKATNCTPYIGRTHFSECFVTVYVDNTQLYDVASADKRVCDGYSSNVCIHIKVLMQIQMLAVLYV